MSFEHLHNATHLNFELNPLAVVVIGEDVLPSHGLPKGRLETLLTRSVGFRPHPTMPE
jgi:hypothetical protein